jgi:hypothetical protein
MATGDSNIERLDFKCEISDNMIEYKCYRKEREAHIEYSHIDEKVYKSYFVLLRTSIDALKKKGYEKVVQMVSEDDWTKYLKGDKWKIKRTIKYRDINLHIIECDIDDAIGCITRGLGFTSK